MNNTQNQKIAQVTDKTLIVGVDIGSENHYARAIMARGFEVSKELRTAAVRNCTKLLYEVLF